MSDEDYYGSDDDERVDRYTRNIYANEIRDILQKAKQNINEYSLAIVHLSQKDLNKLYKGKPFTLSLQATVNFPSKIIFDFIAKDRFNLPSIVYLTLNQFIKYANYNKI